MRRALKASALVLAAALSACAGPRLPAAGLVADGDCVSRTVQAFDPVAGVVEPVRQRFCGGQTRLAPS